MTIIDKDKWQEILGTIRKNKLRTFLTALGVFWGIFMLVFLLGMGKGLENGVLRDFGSAANNVMYVWPQRTTKPYDGYSAGRRLRFNQEDLAALKRELPQIENLAPRAHLGSLPINYKDIQEMYEVRGEETEMPKVQGLVIHQGRYINEADLKERRKVAAIGTRVSTLFFGEGDPIGKHIRVRGVDFKVIGVYGPEQLKPWNQDDTESVVIPLTTMDQAFGTRGEIDYFACLVKEEYKVTEIEDKLKTILKSRHHVHPDDVEAVGGFNLQKAFTQIQGLFLGIKLFLWFVGIGTLIAGIVGVSNIMLIIVKERTKEIGIRKALGATPGSIVNMILTESIFITALSGYLGLAIGSLIIGAISYLMYANNMDIQNFYNPEVDVRVAIFAILVLIIAGLIAGWIPARQASKVNPVIALKDE